MKKKSIHAPRNRQKNLESPKTEFSRWRAIAGVTQQQAARLLGLSPSAIQSYERNVKPNHCSRIVMRMLLDGKKIPDPWPE